MAGKGRPRRIEGRERLRALGFDPLKEMVDYAMTKEPGSRERYEVACELLPYQMPKLRSVEHKPGEGSTVTVTIGGSPNQVTEEQPPDA